MKIITIITIFILICLAIFLTGAGCEKKQEIKWENVSEGKWTATNLSCMNQTEPTPLPYMCIKNCFEKSQSEIWNLCKDKGKIVKTNTNVEVLCFSSGCMPTIVENNCHLVCPI